VEKVWFNLGKEFVLQGHEVTHLSRRHKDLPPEEMLNGVRHRRISGFSSPATTARRMLMDFWYAARISAKLPPADILVTNTFWMPALPHRRSRGLPYVHVARYPKGQLKLYRGAILQTVSNAIREAILAELPAAANRVRVIAYPLSDAYLLPRLGAATKTVLYTGRVHPEKGIHLLLQAFARLPAAERAGWKLKIVGPWEIAFGGGGETYLEQLRHEARDLGDAVEFVGRVFDEKKLIAHYEEARVFVYPSLAERGETFGLAALEAMAAGCAPIVSSLACFRDFVRDGENGWFFDHRAADPAATLSQCLAAALKNTDATEQIRKAAWQSARGYTLPKIAQEFLYDFSQLTAPSAPPTNHT
jgi:glycosyltransferase involved in cell wall biosynthesis